MQVDPVPASPVVLPETPAPAVPVVSSPSQETLSTATNPLASLPPPLLASEEAEQPTFHVMQPPPPTPPPASSSSSISTITPVTTTTPTPPSSTTTTTTTTTTINTATESAMAPTTANYAPLVAVPIAPEQPTVTTAPTVAPPKQTKRGSRSSHSHKQLHRSPAKPATLLARPSTGKPSTILPQPQKQVVLGSQMTPLVPKPITTNGQVVKPANGAAAPGFTTYLVVDGNQGQLVQVANDGQKPITFRNQAGQILQATPITVVSAANQPVVPTFPTNGDATMGMNTSQINGFAHGQPQTSVTSLATQQNSSQTVTTVRTSSSIDMQRTTLTSDTTMLTTQQMTGITQMPATGSLLNGCHVVSHPTPVLQANPTIMSASIINGNSSQSHERDMSPGHHDNDSSLDEPSGFEGSAVQDSGLSLSLSQLARKTNHRHRRSSSSSLSKKKRGRPRLYERDPFTNKPIKSRPTPDGTELTLPNLTSTTTATLLMPNPVTTTTFNTFNPHNTGCTSLIFPNQSITHTTTPLPSANPSLLQQQTYSYPSLLNGNATPTNMLSAPTLNIFSNSTNHQPTSNSYSYSSPSASILPQTPLAPPPPPPPPPPIVPSPAPSTPIPACAPTPTPSRPATIPPLTHAVENQAMIPLKNLQISSSSSPMTSSPRSNAHSTTTTTTTMISNTNTTTIPNVVQLNPSPIKNFNHSTPNNDVVVHYIGGFVIRESSHPFPIDDHRDDDHNDSLKDLNLSNGKEKENTSFNDHPSDLGSDQLRCLYCKKIDFSERFYNQEKRICSRPCSLKPPKQPKNHSNKRVQLDKTPPIHESTRIIETTLPLQPTIESQIDEQIPLPPDHGLPADPSKWTVYQVGDFIARLTNETIREAFFESEMDGQALLLMTQEHLRDTMKIKLGPSLIIASEITKLRERARTFSS